MTNTLSPIRIWFLAAAPWLRKTHMPMVVGDSIWDMLATVRCRALGIGLSSGGYGPDELRRSGAFASTRPAELLRRIDEVGGRRYGLGPMGQGG